MAVLEEKNLFPFHKKPWSGSGSGFCKILDPDPNSLNPDVRNTVEKALVP
jgi:hypothetical protein